MNIKPIPNFPDYYISSSGVVFSKSQKYRQPKPKKPRKLSHHLCFGYPSIHIRKNGKAYKRYIHHLVLNAFVGDCPPEQQCRHLDGNPLNNNLSNLKWGTRGENQMDRLKTGKDNRGEKHGMSKLTKQDILEIRKLATSNIKNFLHKRKKDVGSGYKEIAIKFNVSISTISHVVRRSTWSWV